MSKELNVMLKELNSLQLKGVDQTASYELLFNGDSRLVDMAKIDVAKERVQKGAYFLSRRKSSKLDEYLIIDMYCGQVYKINSKFYTVKVANDNIQVIDNFTGKEQYLIVNGKLNFGDIKHLGMGNYTYFSGDADFKGIPAVRFDNSYKDSIRVHWIIALMNWGIDRINKCVGSSPIFRLRHKVAYKKSEDNSISNLEILTGADDTQDKMHK